MWKKVFPNMPNVDKSEHLNKSLTSKLKHIVTSTLQTFKRIYTVPKIILCTWWDISYQNEFLRQANSTSSLVIHKENMTFHQTIISVALLFESKELYFLWIWSTDIWNISVDVEYEDISGKVLHFTQNTFFTLLPWGKNSFKQIFLWSNILCVLSIATLVHIYQK